MALTRKIEEISFRDEEGNYFDVAVHDGYIEISINDSKDDRMNLTLDEWKCMDKEIRNIFKDMDGGSKKDNDESNNSRK
jgi:hypothetical protein